MRGAASPCSSSVNVPVLGMVENMSYFLCPQCGTRSDIFGHGGARHEAERLGVPFLGEVPLRYCRFARNPMPACRWSRLSRTARMPNLSRHRRPRARRLGRRQPAGAENRHRSLGYYLFFRRAVAGACSTADAADPPDGFCTQKPRLPLAICCRQDCESAYQQCRLPSLSMMHHGASPPAARLGELPQHRLAAMTATPRTT